MHQRNLMLSCAHSLFSCWTGVVPVPYPKSQYDTGASIDFKGLARMMQPKFTLCKVSPGPLPNLFCCTSGVYIIHAGVTHPEDWDVEYAEVATHYVVYNAGTRVLFLYPEVIVVQDADVSAAGLPEFVERLRAPPYLLRLPSGDMRRWVCRVLTAV